jgi:tetratricopeptide (TPR) repeat protein
MDCGVVAREEIAERYLTGGLAEQDREAFEEHYFACARCFDELQVLQGIREELRRPETESESPAPRSILWWLLRPSTAPVLASGIAAAILLSVGLTVWMRAPRPDTVVATKTGPSRPVGAESAQPRASEPSAAPATSIEQLARVEPAPYEPVTLRGPANEATTRFRQGMEWYKKSDYGAAVTDLQAAADIDPGAAHIQFFLGVSHLLNGQDGAAIRHLQATVQLGDSPYLEEAHLYLAKAFLRKHDISAAEADLDAAIRLNGAHADEARRLLADIKRLEKR